MSFRTYVQLTAALTLCVAALAAKPCLAAGQGGVLFYAGFDQETAKAQAIGGGTATPRAGAGALTAAGAGKRGSALKSGDAAGYVEYAATGNIPSDEGTLQFWMYAENWDASDKFPHVLVDVQGEGRLQFRQGADGVLVFELLGRGVTAPGHWDDKGPNYTQRAYGSGIRQGRWILYTLTWKIGKPLGLYIDSYDASSPSDMPAVSPGAFKRILIGDQPVRGRSASTFIDEVTIYDRALTLDEVRWTYEHANDRAVGKDIPPGFNTPTAKATPKPSAKQIVVEVDTGSNITDFGGTATVQTKVGVVSAEIKPIGMRFGQAVFPLKNFAEGEYTVDVKLTCSEARFPPLQARFTVPPPPVWLGNRIGIADTPPPPWPPMKGTAKQINCWGREYRLGALCLPSSIKSVGREILARPVELRFTQNGKTVEWRPLAQSIRLATKAETRILGKAQSAVGIMSYTLSAEYDGMLRYDFELHPSPGATSDTMELRIPLRGDAATLYWMNSAGCGAFPRGRGITMRNGSMQYVWIGNEERGIALVSEDDRAVDHPRAPDEKLPPHCTGWRIEENGGVVEVIWSFSLTEKPRILRKPWQLTFGIQATPVKPMPPNWRLLRAQAPNSNVEVRWPAQGESKFFSPPEPIDPKSYKAMVEDYHKKGMRFIPYSALTWITTGVPEYDFYASDWATGMINDSSADVVAMGRAFAEVYPTKDWTDFVVWLNHRIAKSIGTDGIYVDMSGVPYYTKVEAGLGYMRGDRAVPTRPFFAIRKIYQRAYTMLKTLNPRSLLIAHMSGNLNMPYLSFADIYLDGEGNWRGGLKDNYLDAISLDKFRAEFMGHQYGIIPWFLPQWYGAQLDDKDVATKQSNGQPGQVTVEKSHHLFGLGLLHDFSFWPICGMNAEAAKQFYGVQDTFGIADARFFGYWNNSALIGGQTQEIKASAYRKPKGGALVIVYNVTRQPRTADLTIDWERLKGKGALQVVDAYTEKPVDLNGKSVAIEVPPINYRLLWVK